MSSSKKFPTPFEVIFKIFVQTDGAKRMISQSQKKDGLGENTKKPAHRQVIASDGQGAREQNWLEGIPI